MEQRKKKRTLVFGNIVIWDTKKHKLIICKPS